VLQGQVGSLSGGGNLFFASQAAGVVLDGVTNCRNAINTLFQTRAGGSSTIVIDGPVLLSTALDYTAPIIPAQ